MKDIDCLIIPIDRLTSNTQQFTWDRLNCGWNDYYGWQWAKIDGEYYSLDNLLNYICEKTVGLSELLTNQGFFDQFDIPQLNGIYLLNYLRKNGFSAEIINNLDQKNCSKLRKKRINPLCVAVSSTFHLSTLSLRNLVSVIRDIFPDSIILVGGSYINIQAKYGDEKLLKNIYRIVKPDYLVVASQGERTLKSILTALKNKEYIHNIKNLFFLNLQNRTCFTGAKQEDNSMDENYIRWSKIETENLYPVVNMQTSRSCPNRCSYCTFPELMGKYCIKDLNVVEMELKEIACQAIIKDIIFIDDTLNVNKNRFIGLCRILQKYPIGWYSLIRCDNLDKETVSLMKASGCKGVFIGFESGDDQILKNMNKRAKVNNYKQGLELLKDYDIITFGSFILGFPGETEATLKNTFDLIENYGLDFYAVNGWTYFTFAPINKRKEEFRIEGKMNDWSHYTMDSNETAEHCKYFFSSIKKSIFMPSNTASGELWDIAYLTARKFSINEVKGLCNSYNNIIGLNLLKNYSRNIKKTKYKYIEDLINILTNFKARIE